MTRRLVAIFGVAVALGWMLRGVVNRTGLLPPTAFIAPPSIVSPGGTVIDHHDGTISVRYKADLKCIDGILYEKLFDHWRELSIVAQDVPCL